MASIISNLIDTGGITWPTTAVDGTWVDGNSSELAQLGGFNMPS